MIFDGFNPVVQLDMVSQVQRDVISNTETNGLLAPIIANMSLVFTPAFDSSELIVTASGNCGYQEIDSLGDSSLWVTYESDNIEQILTKIGPLGDESSASRPKFGGLSVHRNLKIESKNPITFRLRANGRDVNGLLSKVNWDFWYLQVQEFRFY